MAGLSKTQAHSKQNFLDMCFKDNSGRIVLMQLPNGPLFVWLVTRFLIIPWSGSYQAFFDYVAYGALFTWAWLEMTSGVNYFRRFLGILVMAYLLKTHLP